ncbi:MAG TPA: hypothetical protein VKA67_03240, partial [Verrucomicrobiae bacterium]|nr:hypothetical protein [Verrucomicrobiae bacterium]
MSATSNAQTQVYSQNFDTDSTADWVTNVVGAGWSAADFYFDYSAVGIPPAPHSTGGTTRGLKMVVNLGVGSAGTFPAGISVSPIGFGLSANENFDMEFDMWLNYDASGNGSTECGGAGYGTAGDSAQTAGQADSIFIATTTDGGSS